MNKNDYSRFDFLSKLFSQLLYAMRIINEEKEDMTFEEYIKKEKDYAYTSEIIAFIVSTYQMNYLGRNISDTILNAKFVHELWYETSEKEGWVYGEIKDKKKKTHPCMVEYDELSFNQKFKDKLLLEIVLSYIDHMKDEFLKGNMTIKDVDLFFNDYKATKRIVQGWFVPK